MKVRALSYYNGDRDTRFGDCILLYDESTLVVYDCGHKEHANYIEQFLKENLLIKQIKVIVSHNDSDHTEGICELLEWLSKEKYFTQLYAHDYIQHIGDILNEINDNRRKSEGIEQAILEKFENIYTIIQKANDLNIPFYEALQNKVTTHASIVGPTKNDMISIVSKAIDNRESDNVGNNLTTETVINALSVQLECMLDNGEKLLLCGDASPEYLKNLEQYNVIQLPHHGQKDDAVAIFTKLGGNAYKKTYLISDNTGSGDNAGGSEELIKYMKDYEYDAAYNTKNKIIDYPIEVNILNKKMKERTCLGDLDCI